MAISREQSRITIVKELLSAWGFDIEKVESSYSVYEHTHIVSVALRIPDGSVKWFTVATAYEDVSIDAEATAAMLRDEIRAYMKTDIYRMQAFIGGTG